LSALAALDRHSLATATDHGSMLRPGFSAIDLERDAPAHARWTASPFSGVARASAGCRRAYIGYADAVSETPFAACGHRSVIVARDDAFLLVEEETRAGVA
jgi:hypothetical protein